MKRSTELLLVACVALLGYIVWLNTRQLVEVELELDRIRGAVTPPDLKKETGSPVVGAGALPNETTT